jgi:putative nucleotidyltransferase with HDIG domain
LKDGRFVAHYTRREGLSTDHVLCLHADPEGTLWIGTAGGGLARLRDGRLSAVTSREGLFDDNVFSILDDGRGHFWMSSNKGLFRVPKSEIEDAADGRRNSVTSYPYGKADGMKSAECNGGVQPAGWKMADGSLWFPTMAGAVAVDPEEMVRPAPPPRLVLEEILVDHSPLPPGSLTRPLALLAGKKSLEFRYTAFAWAAPKDVVFRHKLSGIDDDWVEAGERRTAYYTNIGHGRYTLEIRAGDGMGRWNPQGVDLAISIKPSFMQTPVFFGLCLLALGALAWAVFQVRTQYVLDRKLKILVHERTRELKLEVQERVRAQEAERQSFTRISKNLKDVIDALSKAMESRDPYTQNHQSRVSILVSAIAREMGLPEDAIEGLRVTSVLHDIGKINVPAEFLSSPRKLTEYEYESVKIHSQVGADILSGIDFPWPVAETVLQHHERMDGSGYPRGLRGDEITPWARILAVADVVEAMSSHRPYRPAFDRKEVLAEIRENREKLYDAGATDACLDLFENKGFSFD